GVDDAARGVDVLRDVRLGVGGLEVQELGDDEVRDLVVDRLAEEDDPLVEQAAVDVERAFLAPVGLDDHRDEHACATPWLRFSVRYHAQPWSCPLSRTSFSPSRPTRRGTRCWTRGHGWPTRPRSSSSKAVVDRS